MEEIVAITEARGLLKRLRIDTIPIDVQAIAKHLGFHIKESQTMRSDEAGQLITIGGQRNIVVNGNDARFRRRFTVLHEIAHGVLGLPSVHGAAVSVSQLERYSSRPREEVLCDVFAAECLVPWILLLPMTQELPFDAETIVDLSRKFQASKSCVASRFAQASRDMHAYVLSENGVVRYVASSLMLRERGYWITIGSKLPESSATALARRSANEFANASLDGTVWSSSDYANRVCCDEDAIVMNNWDQALSLLSIEEVRRGGLASQWQDEAERELLPELTGKLPWPRR